MILIEFYINKMYVPFIIPASFSIEKFKQRETRCLLLPNCYAYNFS